MRVNLEGIHKVKAKLADGSKKTYYYAWRGGPKIEGEPGTADFITSHANALADRKKPSDGIFFNLIADYKASSEFRRLAPVTRKGYLVYIKLIEDEFGDLPIAALDQRQVRGVFKEWRDGMADKPRKADYAWTTLARILSVAKDRGKIANNPCERGGRLYDGDRSENIWSDHAIKMMMAACPVELQTALLLGIWTGQRQGDLIALRWSAYDGKYLRVSQSKTKRRVVIPIGNILKSHLDAMTQTGGHILLNTFGKPWTSDGFRTSWGKAFDRAKINEDLTFHDLRGSAVVRLALVDATVPQIASFTGHSLKDVEEILDKHYLGRDVKLAEAAVMRLNENEERSKAVK